MNELRNERLREEGLAFVGKIMAVHSHEVINAFSVINEMSGLQLDILEEASQGQSVDVLELERICEKIRFHVRRGESTIRSVNWIAHRFDQTSAFLDVNETLTKTVAAAEHWTKMKRTSFVLDLPETGASLETHPFFFAYAMFLSIDIAISKAPGEKTISMGYGTVDGGLEFSFENADHELLVSDDEPRIASLRSLMNELGGELRIPRSEGSVYNISLFFPNKRSGGESGKARKKEDR